MVSFLALYRGQDLPNAELVAVSTDADLVAIVAGALLKQAHPPVPDQALRALNQGRRRALRVVAREAGR